MLSSEVSVMTNKASFKTLITLILISLLINPNYMVCHGQANDCASSEFETKSYKSKKQFIKSKYDTAVLADKPEMSIKFKKGCVVVNVKTMCDKAYQNLHKSDWKVRAKRIVENGTKALYSKFNICFVPKKAVTCKLANSQNAENLLVKFTRKYKATKKVDVIIGFSGKNPKYVAGITYIGKIGGGARILIFASTFESEVETVQHEIGHIYDLKHCSNNCVMTNEGFGYLNKFCSAHFKQWKKNRKYYK